MRVIAGEFRSRKLLNVPGLDTRPTPDRLRESLFSILGPRVEDSVFVDAYAGTGSVGIEAVSRGARLAILIENNRAALDAIRQNVSNLGIEARTRILKAHAASAAAEFAQGQIVFADPPYTREQEYSLLLDTLRKVTPPLSIVQHSTRFVLESEFGALRRTRILTQGENTLSFFEV